MESIIAVPLTEPSTQDKPSALMDVHELEREQVHLMEKLKKCNAYLSRMV